MPRGTLNGSKVEKTTLTIPSVVKRAAFRHAAKKRISLSQWITRLLEQAMDSGKAGEVAS
jgi:predicted HicB family RNase H-like nuclease